MLESVRSHKVTERENKADKERIIQILYDYSNPMGYQLVGEDLFERVADEIINKPCDHPLHRTHQVNGIVFCNKCKKTFGH